MLSLAIGLGASLALVLAYGFASPPAGAVATGPLPERPNILLVTIDALRADHLGAYGYARDTSPAIDDFARSAVRFDNAISQAPYTKASIASLMTGLYPSTHKTITATVPFGDAMTGHPVTRPITTDVLPSSATTLAEGLRTAGYRTVGFTTNPFLIEAFGYARGFDTFRFLSRPDLDGADRVVADVREALRATARSRPLFLWVHLMEPHSPYTPPAWTAGTFKVSGAPEPIPPSVPIPSWLLPGTPRDRRWYVTAYDDEVSAADVGFDALIREFRDLRASRPSVIVLTADHGEEFMDHGGWEHNSTLYDELIHVPLVLEVPGVTPRVVAAQVQVIDLFPTLLRLGGADVPPNAGRSLIPVLTRTAASRPAMSEIVGVQYAWRDDGWKLIDHDNGRLELYDLRCDPHEQHDLSTVEPTRAAAMRVALDRTLADAIQRGRRIRAETVPMDPAVADRLRALGYIQR